MVYFCRSGGLCCGGVGNNKVCLKISGTFPVGSHSKKASMTVEGTMILVRSAVKQVSVTAFLDPFISIVGVGEVFIASFINKTGCDWSQEFSMFNDGVSKSERVFEENIDAIATSNNFMQALRSPVFIKECEDYTSLIDSIS